MFVSCTTIVGMIYFLAKQKNEHFNRSDMMLLAACTVCQMGEQITPKTSSAKIATVKSPFYSTWKSIYLSRTTIRGFLCDLNCFLSMCLVRLLFECNFCLQIVHSQHCRFITINIKKPRPFNDTIFSNNESNVCSTQKCIVQRKFQS